jgi:hypothetical protein
MDTSAANTSVDNLVAANTSADSDFSDFTADDIKLMLRRIPGSCRKNAEVWADALFHTGGQTSVGQLRVLTPGMAVDIVAAHAKCSCGVPQLNRFEAPAMVHWLRQWCGGGDSCGGSTAVRTPSKGDGLSRGDSRSITKAFSFQTVVFDLRSSASSLSAFSLPTLGCMDHALSLPSLLVQPQEDAMCIGKGCIDEFGVPMVQQDHQVQPNSGAAHCVASDKHRYDVYDTGWLVVA